MFGLHVALVILCAKVIGPDTFVTGIVTGFAFSDMPREVRKLCLTLRNRSRSEKP